MVYIIAMPWPKRTEEIVIFQLRMKRSLADKLDARIPEIGNSRNDIINRICERFVGAEVEMSDKTAQRREQAQA
jgi:hypothetical protein